MGGQRGDECPPPPCMLCLPLGCPAPFPWDALWGCSTRGAARTEGDARGGVGVLEGATQWGCPIDKGAWLTGVPRDGGAPLMRVFWRQGGTPEVRAHN